MTSLYWFVNLYKITFQVGKEFKLKIEKFGNTFKEAIYTSQNEKFVSSFTLDEENELKGVLIYLNIFSFRKSFITPILMDDYYVFNIFPFQEQTFFGLVQELISIKSSPKKMIL